MIVNVMIATSRVSEVCMAANEWQEHARLMDGQEAAMASSRTNHAGRGRPNQANTSGFWHAWLAYSVTGSWALTGMRNAFEPCNREDHVTSCALLAVQSSFSQRQSPNPKPHNDTMGDIDTVVLGRTVFASS